MPKLKTTADVTAAMRALLAVDPARYWWTAKEWAAFLGTSVDRVQLSDAWDEDVRRYRLAAHAADPKAVDRRLLVSRRKRRPPPPRFP
jgi:hypothetical protein